MAKETYYIEPDGNNPEELGGGKENSEFMMNKNSKKQFYLPKFIRSGHFSKEKFLKENLIEHKEMFTGKILDMGAGLKPYKKFFKEGQYESCDIEGDHTYICDSTAIPVPNNYYSVVFSTQVFEHIKRPWITMREMNRILKMNGELIITVPQAEEMHMIPNHYFNYTRYGLAQLAEDNGFRVMKMEQKGKWFSFIAEQFRKACRYNPHIWILLFPLCEAIVPLTCMGLDFLDFTELNGEGWSMIAVKEKDLL